MASRKYTTKHPMRGVSKYPRKGRRPTMTPLDVLRKQQTCVVHPFANKLLCGC